MGLSGQLHAQASLTPEKSLGARFSRGWVGLRRFLELFKKRKSIFFIQLPGFQLLTFQPITDR
jgi:hypothetical protein